MDGNLEKLKARIAATGDKWQKPGVRVVDPNTGVAFRMRAHVYRDAERNVAWRQFITDEQPSSAPMIFDIQECTERAIASGPDLDDAATIGVLLGLVPDVMVKRKHDLGENGSLVGYWWAGFGPNGFSCVIADTRSEAIALAWLAANEVLNG